MTRFAQREVRYPLNEEGKAFVTDAFIETNADGTITIGIVHRDGHAYVAGTITRELFATDVQFLLKED